MTSDERAAFLAAFRTFLGESKFRRFAVALEQNDDSGLYWWQERALSQFQGTTGTVVPTSKPALRQLFEGVVPRHVLAEAEMPAWCEIEFIGGTASVQAWGRCGNRRWHFRARHEGWSIEVTRLLADATDTDAPFFHQQEYRDGRYDASYMPVDEARYFITEVVIRRASCPVLVVPPKRQSSAA